jgi:hypothetical protein
VSCNQPWSEKENNNRLVLVRGKVFKSAAMRFAGLRNWCKYGSKVYHKPLLSASAVELINRTAPGPAFGQKQLFWVENTLLCLSH